MVLAEGFLKLSSTPTSLAGFHCRNWGVALPMKSLLHKPEDPRALEALTWGAPCSLLATSRFLIRNLVSDKVETYPVDT